MLLALTHAPSPRIHGCQLTYLPRIAIDRGLMRSQHQAYCRALEQCGAKVRLLHAADQFPDCAFIEDTAIILDELAVVASMGVSTRRKEIDYLPDLLKAYRRVDRIASPATLEGGDVLRIDRTLLVGHSPRTSIEGILQLRQLAAPHGYKVIPVAVRGCLHLKTACTALDDQTLLVNPDWVDGDQLSGYRLLPVDQREPWAANVLRIGGHLIASDAHPRTNDRLSRLGWQPLSLDLSEFAKAEAGATCLSLLLKTNLVSR